MARSAATQAVQRNSKTRASRTLDEELRGRNEKLLAWVRFGTRIRSARGPDRGDVTRNRLVDRLNDLFFGANGDSGDRDSDIRETTHDKTLADSFPTSDPPSSIPNPSDIST